MYPTTENLKELIAQAEAGEIEAAREGLREFTRRRPSVLLAWKWLADVAQNPKERAEAVRRAQLLAPGDPWVIEAKKHRMPPKLAPKRRDEAMTTRPLQSPISASAPPPAASGARAPRPDDLTVISRMSRSEALQQAIERSQPPEKAPSLEPAAAQETASAAGRGDARVEKGADDKTVPRMKRESVETESTLDMTRAIPATQREPEPVTAPVLDAAPADHQEVTATPVTAGGWLIWAVVGLGLIGVALLVAAFVTANIF
ncbi:MAG: hypothetical protein ACE5FI_10840 [Anaerolineales bacterium]